MKQGIWQEERSEDKHFISRALADGVARANAEVAKRTTTTLEQIEVEVIQSDANTFSARRLALSTLQ